MAVLAVNSAFGICPNLNTPVKSPMSFTKADKAESHERPFVYACWFMRGFVITLSSIYQCTGILLSRPLITKLLSHSSPNGIEKGFFYFFHFVLTFARRKNGANFFKFIFSS